MSGVIDYGPLYRLVGNLKTITAGATWMFALSHDDLQKEIIRLNQEQLYEEGMRSDGSSLGIYAEYTIEVNKIPHNLPYDRVTLFQNGDFYASFRVHYDEDSFTIDADGDKSDKNLFDVYGDDILGLTKFNIERIKPLLLSYYAEYVKQKIFPVR